MQAWHNFEPALANTREDKLKLTQGKNRDKNQGNTTTQHSTRQENKNTRKNEINYYNTRQNDTKQHDTRQHDTRPWKTTQEKTT
jgi:hypothetical protein